MVVRPPGGPRKTRLTRPSRTASPSERSVGPATRSSPTKVPFLLSRSSRVATPSRTVIRAWRREIDASGMEPRVPGSRPRMFSPSSSRMSCVAPDQAAAGRRRRDGRAFEGVAEAVHGANELGLAGGLGEQRPDLVDERRQARVGHERVRPERPLQLVLRERLRPVLDQELEQLDTPSSRGGAGSAPRNTWWRSVSRVTGPRSSRMGVRSGKSTGTVVGVHFSPSTT